MFNQAVGRNGIHPKTERVHSPEKSKALDKVLKHIEEHKYGFVNMVSVEDYITECETILDQIHWADTLVVVGIGGSDLGGRAIQNALQPIDPQMRVIFFGDTTDPTEFDTLLREIELPTTVINIVSKSGQTVETMAQYLYFQNLYQARHSDWTKHFVFTTDPKSGLLRQEADKYGIQTLTIPEDVGGRFSVLSPVGLFPALAMGIDIEELLEGANVAVEETVKFGPESVAFQLAWNQYLFFNQEIYSVVCMPYSARLNEFARWFRQLWAESLGKDEVGVMPIQAYGPADQHSQLQFYTQGAFLASILFIRVSDHRSSHIIENVEIPELSFLAGKDFADIINVEQSAVVQSLTNAGRPSSTLEIDQVDADTLGEMFMTFELAVTFLAELLQINAFDQPGVEDSKHIIHQMLTENV
jgi:glucose-6-phosphate isomerase